MAEGSIQMILVWALLRQHPEAYVGHYFVKVGKYITISQVSRHLDFQWPNEGTDRLKDLPHNKSWYLPLL